MAIDILNIHPNVVSKDIRSYSFLIYGGPKQPWAFTRKSI